MRSRLRSLGLACAALATLLCASTEALGNGRFPRAQRLLEDPQDDQHLVLAATYGLLLSRDRGQNWFHVCEAAFAEPGVQTDPVVSLLPGNELLTSIYSSLAFSSQGGCDFQRTLGGASEAVPDFTTDASGNVLALVVSTEGALPENRIRESSDGGRTWHELGPALPAAIRLVATIDVAASDPQRLYISGLGPDGGGVLLRSDDRGQSFAAVALPTDAENDETPYIAAIAAHDADVLYVRTDVWQYDELEGVAYAADALLYSDDGGQHFSELWRARGKLFGFALSPSGQELLLGYGDPVEGGGRFTDPDALGIYRAPAGSAAFVREFAGPVSCLTWTEGGVYACTSQAELGFALGFAAGTEPLLTGDAPLSPLLSLAEVRGPLACPRCTSGAACPEYWSAVCSSWGRDDCEALPAAAGQPECSAPEAGAGGAGPGEPTSAGASGMATFDPEMPATTGGLPAAEDTPRSPPAASACGCRAPGGASKSGGSGLLLLALGLVWRRRAWVALVPALGLLGCGPNEHDPNQHPPDDSECSGDFDEYEAGMTRQAEPGEVTVELVESDPAPPAVRKDNVWWLRLSDAEGEPVLGAELLVTPFMPKHQHGSAEVVIEELGDGEYKLSPIELIMPGVWEIPVSVTPPDSEASEMTFRFCIAER